MPPTNDPPQPTDRPVCQSCGWTMWIARVEPLDAAKHKHVYKCERCEHEQEIVVKL